MHSLVGTLPDLPDGKVGGYWAAAFTPLTSLQRVLDIGTGNGVLPALLCKLFPVDMPQVDAVDLAELAPRWLGQLPVQHKDQIHFYGGIEAEALPFSSAQFDLVVSQYGIEYAQREAAFAEVARVLRPRGRVCLLLHHADSHLALVANEECVHTRFLLAQEGLLVQARKMLPFVAQGMGSAAEVDWKAPNAMAVRSTFEQALQQLDMRLRGAKVPDLLHEARAHLGQIFDAAARSRDVSVGVEALNTWVIALEDAALRYEELCSSALTEASIAELADLLVQMGFVDIHYEPFVHESGYLIGWALQARRGA